MTDGTGSTAPALELDLLAPADRLASRVGRSANDAVLLERLRGASDRFRSAVHFHVSERVNDVLYPFGNGDSLLHLGTSPVSSVASVMVDGRLLNRSSYKLQRRLGTLELVGGGVWSRRADVEVVCTHGYAADHIPNDIVEAVLEAAEIAMTVQAGVQSRTVLGDSVTFGSSAVGVTQKWVDAVANYVQAAGDNA
jgi:hypothetical protein